MSAGPNNAARLRTAFDASFAKPAGAARSASGGYLAVRVGGDPYVIALTEVAGLFASHKIAPLPSRHPAVLGVAGLRGEIVPVFSLRALLGRPAANEQWHLLVVAAGAPTAAFTVERLEGYVQAPDDGLSAEPDGHARATVNFGGQPWPIISIRSLIGAITERAAQ